MKVDQLALKHVDQISFSSVNLREHCFNELLKHDFFILMSIIHYIKCIKLLLKSWPFTRLPLTPMSCHVAFLAGHL
jgi:hypothetical protein